MKKWEVLYKDKIQPSDLVEVLLNNRGIKTKKEKEEFLNPKLEEVTSKSVGINQTELKKAVARIKTAIKNEEKIIVFGDYDVDGICGAAILWETLNSMGAKVMPHLPHRIDEGYGLSLPGITNILGTMPDVKLIITVDNGIVANEPVDFARKQGIDVIITDHHTPSKKLPKAFAIVHTTKLCGAAVGFMLAKELVGSAENGEHLALAALASVADLVPLVGPSRTVTKYGIESLRKTKRAGILALISEAGITTDQVGTYEIGHIIAPRINAMGRMESAMDSLRLLCTPNRERANELAHKLSFTNTERQKTTQEAVLHAKTLVQKEMVKHLIFISHETYQQGVIGLVASKLVEEYYVPSIVISKGAEYSKASARSISGFNIIDFIRSASEYLVDAGGHPMAAGFTVETKKLELLQKKLYELAQKQVKKKLLTQVLRVDCELPIEGVTFELYQDLQKMSPFGMGNPMPTFTASGVVESMRVVGNGAKHLKLRISGMDAIWFRGGESASEFHIGDKVSLVYTIDQDTWNGNRKLQLKIRDIKL